MSLDPAVAAAEALRRILEEEVEAARRERQLLRKLDIEGIFDRASQRGMFFDRVRRAESRLAAELSRAAAALGLREVTLEGLRRSAPVDGERLAQVFAEIRALAGALSELDRLNHALAGRALACVRGYVDAIAPVPRAYDRRGTRAHAPAPALASVSSKV